MHDVAMVIETDVPCRLDRLPWTRFHTLVVVALGITWVLDGLEVTIAGSIAGALEESPVLHFTAAEVGLAASAYLVGAVSGALLFGYLTDRFGRRKLFMVTLGLYLAATAATALSWDFWSFAVFRVLTGAGIGGEYAAINSAAAPIWRSAAAFGSARRSAAWGRSSSCDPVYCRRIGAGAPLSASARCSASAFCCCAGGSRKARAG